MIRSSMHFPEALRCIANAGSAEHATMLPEDMLAPNATTAGDSSPSRSTQEQPTLFQFLGAGQINITPGSWHPSWVPAVVQWEHRHAGETDRGDGDGDGDEAQTGQTPP